MPYSKGFGALDDIVSSSLHNHLLTLLFAYCVHISQNFGKNCTDGVVGNGSIQEKQDGKTPTSTTTTTTPRRSRQDNAIMQHLQLDFVSFQLNCRQSLQEGIQED